MYTAPGHNPDQLEDDLLKKWNQTLSKLFDGEIDTAKGEVNPPSERAWIYNPISNGGGEVVEQKIDWTGFPKTIKTKHNIPDDAWLAADNNRDLQEEYCEWEVARDSNNRIVRVTVTCETQDYFEFLAEEAPEKLREVYRRYVSKEVELSDLVVGEKYRPQNKWNYPQKMGAHGVIMHMAQKNNSFRAAVNLSSIASWPRKNAAGQLITGEQPLIACRGFGVAGRHSDPHIGAEINRLVRGGNEVSFADPVGLYIDLIDTQGWEFPGNHASAKDWFKIQRGTAEFPMRVVFEAPEGSQFVLGDVKIDGAEVELGGQIIDRLKIRITGIARRAAEPAPSLSCQDTSARAHVMLSTSTRPLLLPKGPLRASPAISILSAE